MSMVRILPYLVLEILIFIAAPAGDPVFTAYWTAHLDNDSHLASKDAKCERSLKRYHPVADRAELISPGFVHHQGHPISQHTNAGLSRRRKAVCRPVFDNSPPDTDVTGTWGKDWE
jgi:hypothetical protein